MRIFLDFMGFYANISGFHGILWEYFWISRDFIGIFLDFTGFYGNISGFHVILWEYFRISWDFMRIFGFFMDFRDYFWKSVRDF